VSPLGAGASVAQAEAWHLATPVQAGYLEAVAPNRKAAFPEPRHGVPLSLSSGIIGILDRQLWQRGECPAREGLVKRSQLLILYVAGPPVEDDLVLVEEK